MLELSGLFVCLEGLIKFFSAWGTETIAGLWFARGSSTQADTVLVLKQAHVTNTVTISQEIARATTVDF